MINPNSANQWWSKWTIIVSPARSIMRDDPTVRVNVARFLRKAFGSASQARVTKMKSGLWFIEVRTEGHPAHDPAYVAHMSSAFTKFFIMGFGVGTKVKTTARLEAGSAQDGTPASQLLVLPSVLGV